VKAERCKEEAAMIKPAETPSPMEEDIGDISRERIWSEWASGKSPRKIAEELGRPVKTIYLILNELERALCEGWMNSKAPEEIVRETGLPLETIIRTLEKMGKAAIEANRG
jgi:hypothetical protein